MSCPRGPLRKALPLLELNDGAAMMLEATSEEFVVRRG